LRHRLKTEQFLTNREIKSKKGYKKFFMVFFSFFASLNLQRFENISQRS